MSFFEIGMFIENRHMVDTEAIDRHNHGHHKDRDHDFPDAREIAFGGRQLPVEGDHGDVEAVQDNTGNSIHGGVLAQLGFPS